ncbi:hypothetical protein GCM10009584_03360 [Ornithinimicrobium humiphilum]
MSAAGLVPVIALAEQAGLGELAQQRLSVPTDKGANAGAKVCALVGGMVAGADSIDDMALLRHGAMKKVFSACYAPSTLGSFLRAFTFGHVRQLDAVASRVLTNLAHATPVVKGLDEYAVGDVDDTIIEVHGYAKQGAGFGYTRVRGLNALLATVTTEQAAPVIVASGCARARSAPRAGRAGWSPTPWRRWPGCAAPGPAGRCWCALTRRSTATPPSVPPSAPARTSRSPSA